MRFPLFLLCGVFAAAASSVGCSDHSDGPSAQQSFADQFCTQFQPCCSSANLATDGGTCQAWVAQQAKLGTYDGDAGAACLAALQLTQGTPSACADDLGSAAASAACFRVFPPTYGTVQPGGPCLRDSDCQAAPGGSAACFVAVDFSEDAGAGSSTHACVQTNPGKAGDGPCLDEVVGAQTQSSWPSGMPVPAQTYSCSLSDGVYCDFTSHQCTAFSPVGGPCTSGAQFACGPTGACEGDGTTAECVALAQGVSCTPGFSTCGAGAHCSSSSFACVASQPLGGACTSDDPCDDACVGGVCVTAAQSTLCGTAASGG